MRAMFIGAAVALALLSGAATAEAGCLTGAAVGGVAGHMVGHGVAGAAAGCAVGHHNAAKTSQQHTGAASSTGGTSDSTTH